MARLILNWEGVDLVTHELIDDTVMVGRAPSNTIIIEHLTVSAEHAVLLRVADSYFLKDLNSTNGTQLNGVLVTEADLKDGDTIRFGSVIAVFAGCSRKRSSTCAIRRFWTGSTRRPKCGTTPRGDGKEKKELDETTTQQLGQVDAVAAHGGIKYGLAIQDALADLLTRKAVGESLLTYLDKEASTSRDATLQSAINFWVNHIRRLKDRQTDEADTMINTYEPKSDSKE